MVVKLSSAAQFDLFKIAMDGLDQFGPVQVAKYEAGLQKALDHLDRHPHSAAEHAEYKPPVRVFPFQAHIIIFEIQGDDIFVIRVCHSREDWTRFV